jgi:hypothetical protein
MYHLQIERVSTVMSENSSSNQTKPSRLSNGLIYLHPYSLLSHVGKIQENIFIYVIDSLHLA